MMGMAQVTETRHVCDICGLPAVTGYHVRGLQERSAKRIDLCEEHDAPVRTVVEAARHARASGRPVKRVYPSLTELKAEKNPAEAKEKPQRRTRRG